MSFRVKLRIVRLHMPVLVDSEGEWDERWLAFNQTKARHAALWVQ
jgi:hypothetical protein